MSNNKEKAKSLTVFKTDRHEDIAAIILAAVTVAAVLFYMAFITLRLLLRPTPTEDSLMLPLKRIPM